MKIVLDMNKEEVEKLVDACNHLAEETHDHAVPNSIWESEAWWKDLANSLRSQIQNNSGT